MNWAGAPLLGKANSALRNSAHAQIHSPSQRICQLSQSVTIISSEHISINCNEMSDPVSVISAITGLVAVSAQLVVLAKQLYSSANDAPSSIALIRDEMEHLHLVFVQVEIFVQGTAEKTPRKNRLIMISLHSLMTVLSGCVLVFSNLDKRLCEVAGLVDPDSTDTQKPSKRKVLQCTADRIKWALWKEAEVGVILQDLQRHKLSLNLMLSIIQW